MMAPFVVFSQNTAKEQNNKSLNAVYPKLDSIKKPRIKLTYLLDQIEDVRVNKPNDAHLLAVEARKVASENKLKLAIAKATYWEIATSYEKDIWSENLRLADQLLLNGFNTVEKSSDTLWMARYLALLAIINYNIEEDSISLAYYERLKKLTANKQKDKTFSEVIGDGFRLRANHFFINDQADSCITYYNKAIEQYASNSMANNRRIALVYMNRAMLATTLEAYDESSLFFQKALKWARNNNSLLGDVYLEWANNLSEKALQQPDYPELHQSNQLLRRADSLGCSSRSRMLYQLGANHQNLALYLYDEEPIRYDSLVNLAANYYRQTIQNAIKEKNISILPQVSTTIAQLFEMGSIKEDKAIMSALSEGYLTSYDSLKVVQQKREELLIDQNEQNILQEKQARLRVIYLFTALLILVAFGLLFYSQQQKIKNLKLQFDIKMEALRSQMNSHFISNTLNAIDSLIMEGRKEEASNYIVGFSRLCRNILNSSKKSYISLHDEIEILKGYLKFEKLRLGDRLMIHWDIDASIDLVHQMVPSLILQPFVENAIWHGILNKPDRSPGNLTVAISNQSKEHLVCIIEDDGIGREKAKAIRSEQSIEWQSWGMKITNERIKALQQIKDAKLEIIDLYDEHDKGIGTKVMIYLPKEVKNNT